MTAGEVSDRSFGDWLKRLRKAHGLTQGELAKCVGCSPVTVQKIEENVRRPSAQIAELLAGCLEIPTAERDAFVQFARGEQAAAQRQAASIEEPAPWQTGQSAQAAPNEQPAPPHPTHNLPNRPTTLVGRRREVDAAIQKLLLPGVHLMTMTGPPGTGKTRLSLKVAGDLLGNFPDGVFFVPLAPVTDPNLVPLTIAQTLNIHVGSGRTPLEALKEHLRGKRMLLVLDNFEQVLAGGLHVAELIEAAPQLKVLVTSREALNLYGEHGYPVPPLTMPEKDKRVELEMLSGYEALTLFVERAMLVRPDFAFTQENADTVAEICHRLDGLPLAIELAAARAKFLSPAAILARLESRLNLLTSGLQDLPTRQRTLRGAIDWSYSLLDDEEKAVFYRLGVFVDGFTLEAAEAVCEQIENSTQHAVRTTQDSLDGLMALAGKSLLQQEQDEQGEPRFTMLETIREYALEQLAERGEGEATRQAHTLYYLALAERAEPKLTSPERGEWLGRLDRERNNFRAAMTWCISHAESETQATAAPPAQTANYTELALRLSGALGWYWYFRGYLAEGRIWLERALAQAGDLRHSTPGVRVLSALGRLALLQQDHATARSSLEEGVAAWRKLGDKRGLAYSLTFLGIIEAQHGQAISRVFIEESKSLFTELGDKWGLAHALDYLAGAEIWLGNVEFTITLYNQSLSLYRELGGKWDIAHELAAIGRAALIQGDYVAARPWLEEALELQQQLGDMWDIAQSFRNLGDVLLSQGEYRQAGNFYEQSYALYRQLGDRVRMAALLRIIGHIVRHQGERQRSVELYERSLILSQELGNEQLLTWCVAAWAGLAHAHEQPERAAKLLGAAEALCQASQAFMPPADLVEYNRTLAAVRDTLTEETFAAAWAEGQAMSLKQALAYATEMLVHA